MKRYFFPALCALIAAGFVFLLSQYFARNFSLAPGRKPAKVYVVGVVQTSPTLDAIWESFRTKMQELGYQEDRNIIYKLAQVGEDYVQTKKNVAALMDQHLDLIYPLGGLATHAAKDLTDERGITIPIVFGITADPVRAHLVADLKSSGNNLTGIVSANEIVSSKRLELLLQMDHKIKRIIFPWNDPVTTGIETFRKTARALGLTLVERKVSSAGEIDEFLKSFQFRTGDALFRASDNISATRVEMMAQLALEKRIPFSGTNAFDTDAGALMSYGANYQNMGAQAAVLADRILSGQATPSELPIELPTEFDLVVNLGTAQKIGVEVPPEFQAKATRLIP